MTAEPLVPPTGRDHFHVAWRLALLGWAVCALLQLALHSRPGPYGGPHLLEWRRYLGWALYYDLLGLWLIALPFLFLWLFLWRRPLGRKWIWAQRALILLIAVNAALSAIDHEVQRFLGTRLSISFLVVYANASTLADRLFHDVMIEDEGGAALPLVLLVAAPLLFLALALRILRGLGCKPAPPLWLAAAIAVLPLAAPANAWLQATSQFRLRKTEPVLLALVADFRNGWSDLDRPSDFQALAADWQARWRAESGDPDWSFPDPERPYLRVPAAPAEPPSGGRWNVIYVQLETLRGVDTGILNPGRSSPTPFLDSLARRSQSALFARASSFAMPTINGMFATHCSIAPHSRRFITSFTATSLYCLPEALRRRGWRAEMFNAGDTDWDGSSLWLKRWYDRLWRFPSAERHDRPVFRAAARRIAELGRSGRPFFASVVSVSNHTPFLSPEPAFEPGTAGNPSTRIRATTRYTDDVLREFVEALEREPWFERTILVVVGDHGFNLGEHRTPAGQLSLYRESVWVPFLVVAPHPRLPRGRIDRPASLLDVAPTLADLLGIREPVPWQGRSLAAGGEGGSLFFGQRGWRLAETGGWTVVAAPGEAPPELFSPDRDWLQRAPVRGREALAERLSARAAAAARLNDYLLRRDLVWDPGRATALSAAPR